MFEGETGKRMMIEQGYVPETCTLPIEVAGPLVFFETKAGRDPCSGCNHDRDVCKGRPKTWLGRRRARSRRLKREK